MGSATNYLESALLELVLRNDTSFAPSENVYLAFFTANPGETGVVTNEIADSNNYSRSIITFKENVDGVCKNNAFLSPEASGSWGTVTYFAITKSDTHNADDLLFYGEMDVQQSISAGISISIPEDSITISVT